MRVNLLAEEKSVIKINWLRVTITILILVMFLGLGYNYYLINLQQRIKRSEIETIEGELEVYLVQERKYKELQSKIEELKERPDIPQYAWDGPIEALGYLTPGQVMLNNLNVDSRQLVLTGRARHAEDLREFRDQLKSSSYFDSINLNRLEKKEEVTFRISAELTGEGE